MKLYYLDAPAGAGKTHAQVREAIKLVDEDKYVLIIQPTLRLIEQTVYNIESQTQSIYVKTITQASIAEGEKVGGVLSNYLKKPYFQPHILVITWEAFASLPYAAGKHRWHIMVDEIPQSYRFIEGEFVHSHKTITSHLETEQAFSSYSLLKVTNKKGIRKIIANTKKVATYQELQPLARLLYSEKWNSYVLTDDYVSLINNASSHSKLTVYSILRPDVFAGYASVVISGACFKDSILFHAFTKQGVEFIEHYRLKTCLRYTEHKNGHLATFLYCSNLRWSKTYRDKDERAALKAIVAGSLKAMNEQEFIWAANNDIIDDNLFGNNYSHLRLPNYAHGLNRFTSYNNVIYLTASNLKPDQCRVLEDYLSVDRGVIQAGIHFSSAYQAVLRSSLRDPDNNDLKIIFVPDYDTAYRLHSYFPNSRLEMVDIDIDQTIKKAGRTRIHTSDADKVRKHRLNRTLKLLEPLFAGSGVSIVSVDDCNENTLLCGNIVTQFRASLFTAINSRRASSNLITESLEEFEQCLESRSKAYVTGKNKNPLFSPALFDPSLEMMTDRGFDNVVMTTSIWLDFDGGDLAPDVFASMFPELRMTIYNTYSSTKDMLRYRAYIPANDIIGPEQYKEFTLRIIDIVRENGFVDKKSTKKTGSKFHGVDLGKLGPASLFYLPCQPKDVSGAFFKTYSGDGRKPLDVDEWVRLVSAKTETDVPDELPPCIPDYDSSNDPRKQVRIQAAITWWQNECLIPENGNRAFFSLAGKLEYAGCDISEIRLILTDQSKHAIHPDERLKDIPRILDRLSKNAGKYRPIYIQKAERTVPSIGDGNSDVDMSDISFYTGEHLINDDLTA